MVNGGKEYEVVKQYKGWSKINNWVYSSSLLAGIVGVIGITKIKKIDQNYTNLYTNYGASIADVASASISFQRLKINLNNITMYRDGRDMSDYVNRIKITM